MQTLTDGLARARALQSDGRDAEAEALYGQMLAALPDNVQLLVCAGAFEFGRERFAEAARHFRAAAALAPSEPSPPLNLGHALANIHRFEEALAAYQDAARTAPSRHAPALGIANCLRHLGRIEDSLPFFARAAELSPEDPDLHCAHGNALLACRQYEPAILAYRRAVAIRPDEPGLVNNLASALRFTGDMSAAAAAYRQAIALKPDYADAMANLALTLRDQGHVTEGVALLRRALDVDPAAPGNHSNLIFCLDFLPDLDVAAHQAERRLWQQRHERPLFAEREPHRNPATLDRKLRIGYVSADFKVHSASALFGPIVLGHDRSRFDVTCYSTTVGEDFRTAMFVQQTRFLRVGHLSDAALAAQIREDGIDILVDLSGHTAGNRLLAFARKPAPVQVTAWGHATSTGLEAMDYFFADPYLVPAAERHLYAEEIADLPCLLCFEAPHYAPDVAPLPADSLGAVTFGCLNRLAKVSGEVLEVWAEILQGTPGSRLLLKGARMEDPANQARFRQVMTARGIAPERLVFRGETPHIRHLEAYGEVDIALDPFPYCGGTTTCEALWMGAPVIAMAGRIPASRLGVAILSALGFPGLVASDKAGYVALARGLAANRELLRQLRRELRPRFAASPVGNVALYTQAVEDAYRRMWRDWVERQPGRG